MAEPEVTTPMETEKDIRSFFSDIFDKLSKGVNVDITPEMEASLRKALSDDDLVAAIPELTDMVYRIFVMRELHMNMLDGRRSPQFSLNFMDQKVEQYASLNERVFDSHTLKMQTLKIKEAMTDRLAFI